MIPVATFLLFGRTVQPAFRVSCFLFLSSVLVSCFLLLSSRVFLHLLTPSPIMAEAYYKKELRELMALPENKSEPLRRRSSLSRCSQLISP